MGWDQFLPFITTVVAIQFSDLLIGIAIGMAVSVFFILRNNSKRAYSINQEPQQDKGKITIELAEDVTFLNKGTIITTLDEIPKNSSVVIDGTKSHFIDVDVLEIIHDFKATAEHRKINLELKNIPAFNGMAGH